MFEVILLSFLTTATYDVSLSEADMHMLEETMCLADNIYHESRNQGTAGQLAVAAVTLNRANDERFPDSICDVVKQGPTKPSWKTGEPIPVRHRCQFSWYCDGKDDTPQDMTTFQNIYDLSYDIVYGNILLIDITDGATHYHADYVNPSWASSKEKTTEIEDHIFYRWN